MRPLRYGASGRLSTNYMLVKDDVGRAKPFTQHLPKNNHYYGVPIPRDDEDATEGTETVFIIIQISYNKMELSWVF